MQHILGQALRASALALARIACLHPTCCGLSCQLHLLQLPARAVTLQRKRTHLKAGGPEGHSSAKLASQQRSCTCRHTVLCRSVQLEMLDGPVGYKAASSSTVLPYGKPPAAPPWRSQASRQPPGQPSSPQQRPGVQLSPPCTYPQLHGAVQPPRPLPGGHRGGQLPLPDPFLCSKMYGSESVQNTWTAWRASLQLSYVQ